MTSFKVWLLPVVLTVVLLQGCNTNAIVDSNVAMPSRNWNYANKVKVSLNITDNSKPYTIRFKLRHAANYAYSNIFILLHIKGAGQKMQTKRYEYRLAQPDGQWNGSGSGNLFTYSLPLFANYHFPSPGNYEIEIEQNMRDNPLKGISDAGITVLKQGQ